MRFPAGEPPVRTEVGRRRGGLIEFLGADGAGVYGPYVARLPCRYAARLRFRAGWAPGGTAVLDVPADNGETRIASRPLVVEATLSGVEVRLFCRPGFTGALEAAEIDAAAA